MFAAAVAEKDLCRLEGMSMSACPVSCTCLICGSCVDAIDASVVRPGSDARSCCCLWYSSALPVLRLAVRVWKFGCWYNVLLIGAWVDADDDRDISLRNIGPAGNGEGIRAWFVEPW